MPDGSRISEPRAVESTERDWCQRLRLEGQARNVHGLSHEPPSSESPSSYPIRHDANPRQLFSPLPRPLVSSISEAVSRNSSKYADDRPGQPQSHSGRKARHKRVFPRRGLQRCSHRRRNNRRVCRPRWRVALHDQQSSRWSFRQPRDHRPRCSCSNLDQRTDRLPQCI